MFIDALIGRSPEIRQGNYHLSIHPKTDNLTLGYYSQRRWMPVYFRSMREYREYAGMPKNIAEIVAENDHQLVEVGAGIAQLAPEIAKSARKKPIVIDPVNYEHIYTLLKKASKKNVSEDNKRKIEVLMARVLLYLDPSAIEVIPLTLQEAYSTIGPRLEGLADIVVDVAGALYYSHEGVMKRANFDLENNWLLKQNPKGTLYTDQSWLVK